MRETTWARVSAAGVGAGVVRGAAEWQAPQRCAPIRTATVEPSTLKATLMLGTSMASRYSVASSSSCARERVRGARSVSATAPQRRAAAAAARTVTA